jgi:hypothetical protein
MSNTPYHNNDNEGFEYLIELSGSGKEAVVGTVEQPFVDYWSTRTPRELTSYVSAYDCERPRLPSSAEVHSPWHELDNMAHVNGPFSNGMKVTISNGFDDLARYSLSPFAGLPTLPRSSNSDLRLKKYRPVTNMLVIENHQHHILRYSLTLDKPFDPRKILFTEDEIDGLGFHDKIIYNDNEVPWTTWDVQGRKLVSKIVTKKAR